MRWFALTIVLLAASAGLASWIYLRDRQDANWRAPERALARADAHTVLARLSGRQCTHGCSVRVWSGSQPGHWFTSVRFDSTRRCFDIDLDRFSTTDSGLKGLRSLSCSAVAGS